MRGGEDDKLFAEIYAQFLRFRVQDHRGYVLDGKFAFNESVLCDKVLIVHGVLRFNEYANHEHDTKQANANQERRFQSVGKSAYAKARDTPNGNAHASRAKQKYRYTQKINRLGKFNFKAYAFTFFFLHGSIITRRREKCKLKAKLFRFSNKKIM